VPVCMPQDRCQWVIPGSVPHERLVERVEADDLTSVGMQQQADLAEAEQKLANLAWRRPRGAARQSCCAGIGRVWCGCNRIEPRRRFRPGKLRTLRGRPPRMGTPCHVRKG
jgi:hypothetical protein